MRSNISRTSSARCAPEGSQLRDPSGALPTPPTQFLGGFFDPRLRRFLSLLGDDVEQAREVGSPRLQGDRATRGDKPRAVADHTASHCHEPWLVQARYRLDRQRIGVVPDQHVVVGHPAPRIVGVEPLLQVPERLGHDPRPHVFCGKARDGQEKGVLERELWSAAGSLSHLVLPFEPLARRLAGPPEVIFGVGCRDKASLVLAGSQIDPAGEHVPEEVLECPGVRGCRRCEVRHGAGGEEDAHHRADLVYGDRLAPCRGGYALPPALAEILEPVVEARLSRGAQCREARGHRERVAREGARLVDGARGRDQLHDLTPPPERTDRQPAADDLTQARQVGRDAETFLRPAAGEPEPGHDLIEDEDGTVSGCDLPESLQIPIFGWHAAHVPCYGLQDYGGEPLSLAREEIPHRLEVVVGQNGGILGSPSGDTRAIGEAEGGHARAGRDEEGVAVAVVVAVELEDLLSSRVSAGEPDGAHRRLRPRVGHPDCLYRRDGPAHQLSELDLEFRRGTEGRALSGHGLYCLDNLRECVPEHERTVAHHVVQIGIAVDVEDARTFTALHEQRISTDRSEGPHRAVHATRRLPDGPVHKPRRTISGELCPRVYAIFPALQTRQPPSQRHCLKSITSNRYRP